MFKVTIKRRDGQIHGGAEFPTLPKAQTYAQNIQNHIADDGLPYFLVQPIEDMITDVSAEHQQKQTNEQAKAFLASSDWQVLRHIRQKALNQPTSLSEEEYLALEQQRADAAASIIEE